MNYLKYVYFIFLLPIIGSEIQAQEKALTPLDSIINSYQDHEGYDQKAYPCFLHNEHFF